MHKQVGIKEIAKRVGVSMATVSLALNGHTRVAETTRNTILQVAKELGYIPNARARALARRKTDIVGLVVPDIRNNFYAELATHIDLALQEHGLNLLLCNTNLDETREKVYVEMAKQGRMDALIFASSGNFSPSINEAQVNELHARFLPVIAVHREAQFGLIPTIDSDRKMGITRIVDHLVEKGHGKIAFMGGYNELGDCEKLLSGFLEQMKHHGLEVPKQDILDGQYTLQGGYKETHQRLLASFLPSAICCANDQMAVGVLRALHEKKLQVPKDIAVTGFDDSEMARYSIPTLTSVNLNTSGVGLTVAKTLIALLKDEPVPAFQVYPTRLMVRESTDISREMPL